jgi:hypothetical protein
MALAEPAGVVVPEGAPPPYVALTLLLARILAGSPSVYWGVQRHNPFAAGARELLRTCLADLDRIVALDDEAAFESLLSKLSTGLVSRSDLARHAREMLDRLPVIAPQVEPGAR